MRYDEFLMELEHIALDNNLRLIMNRAASGCGFFFYFINDCGDRSDYRVFLTNHMTPEELFKELDTVAKAFRKEKKDEIYNCVC